MKTKASHMVLFTLIGGALFVYGARGQAEPRDSARRAALPAAAPLTCAASASPFIDDMEDADASTLDGFGGWYVFDDEDPLSTDTLSDLANPVAPGGPGRSRFAARIAGSGFIRYAGMGVTLGCARDAGAFEGYRFAVKAGGPRSFDTKVPTAATVQAANGGACTADCEDHFSTPTDPSLTLSDGGWHECSIRFCDLAQQGYGAPVAFDVGTVMGMEFIAQADDQPFDITVDNVELAAHVARTECVPIQRHEGAPGHHDHHGQRHGRR